MVKMQFGAGGTVLIAHSSSCGLNSDTENIFFSSFLQERERGKILSQ